MVRRCAAGLLWMLVSVIALGACAPKEDWTDPEWIGRRMLVADERAFNEFTRLSDEQKATLVPTLIEVYDSGLMMERALQCLLMVPDASARATFENALSRSDDHLAAVGARGLAAIGASDASQAVAQRLAQVTAPSEFGPFMDALSQIPTAEAAEVIASVLLRPADSISIDTVKSGCAILGGIENPSDAVLGALVFSLANFETNPPFRDAINECELALLEQGDAAVPALTELFNQNNERVNTFLRNADYPLVSGQIRAALVLAHMHSPAALAPINAWYSENHAVPLSELQEMEIEEQQDWFNTHGQLFDVTTMGLAYSGRDEDRTMLLSLERPSAEGEDPPRRLDNFSGWFGLSDSAEIGLRQSVYEALMMIGNPEDHELMWDVVNNGVSQRCATRTIAPNECFANETLRINVLHYVGRGARAGEVPRYEEAFAAQSTDWQSDFRPHRAYFVLADLCGDDVSCYVNAINDPSAVRNDPGIQEVLNAPPPEDLPPEAQQQVVQMVSLGVDSCVHSGAVWQLAVRFGSDPQAGEALLANLRNDDMEVRMNISEALLVIDNLPADTVARIDQVLADEEGTRAPLMREFRHNLRLVKAIRF